MRHNEGMMGPGMHGPMMRGAMMQGGMQGMHGGGQHGGGQSMQPKGDTGPSSLAFHGINMKMHGAMDIAYTGNADVDFVKGMIPHHQGAIDMAVLELRYGKNEQLRRIAQEIIVGQMQEIAAMKLAIGEQAPVPLPAPTQTDQAPAAHQHMDMPAGMKK
jgi:uncharacterized protein (DUF305 family)